MMRMVAVRYIMMKLYDEDYSGLFIIKGFQKLYIMIFTKEDTP